MKVYFSCSITGGRDDQPIYRQLVEALLKDGHMVPTAHLADGTIPSAEKVVEAGNVFRRDIGWVNECDVMVAEVSTPSHGVGYEIALAEFSGKPVFICFRSGTIVSKMLLGNPSPLFKFCAYQSTKEAIENMRVFLKRSAKE
jgi:nucleoside 2-deoxyribosyltransferase